MEEQKGQQTKKEEEINLRWDWLWEREEITDEFVGVRNVFFFIKTERLKEKWEEREKQEREREEREKVGRDGRRQSEVWGVDSRTAASGEPGLDIIPTQGGCSHFIKG